MDGPDGLNYYWHDLRKDKITFSKRQQGGGGVMFWGGIGGLGLTPLVKVEGRMNSVMYQQLLANNLIPNVNRISGRGWIFQQDGASCHRSHSTMNWLREQNIDTIEWPPYSPDMNITENLWGIMARQVYPDGKQYINVQELETACQLVWSQINQEYINMLFESMPRRVQELEMSRGGHTTY